MNTPSPKRLVIERTKTIDFSRFVRELMLNYSDSEIGIRHPHGPVGFLTRDQGIADIYAGRSRLSLTVDGIIGAVSKVFGISSDEIYLNASDIRNLRINGKSFDRDTFLGKPVSSVIGSLDDLGLIGPATITERGDRIINTVPLNTIFEATILFESSTDDQLIPHDIELFNLIEGALKS